MTERLLQFIWQFQYYNKSELATTSGESLQVIFPGNFNSNQGPDFLDAKIKIGETFWVGTVELHILASGWEKHNHEEDRNYKNVILHVVWEEDDNSRNIPALELKSRVPKLLLLQYEEWMYSAAFIPCEKNIHTVKEITWRSWKERLLAERLLEKAKMVDSFQARNNHHWEETFWRMLSRNFGIRVNADAFEAIAGSVSTNILARHKNNLQQLEAILFGQAGMLRRNFRDEYPRSLFKEYVFLKKLYALKPVHQPLHLLRMRPVSFPAVRLAQLAALIFKAEHLFRSVIAENSVKQTRKLFEVTASDYWNTHYRFDEGSSYQKKTTGSLMIDSIIINTIAPVLFAYGQYHGNEKYKNKALQWLEETGAERNTITTGFQHCGIRAGNAFDSQALVQLKTRYCNRKMCLECAVGNFLLKQGN